MREITPYVQMHLAGLAPHGRPAGVFLLLGPTGTGKTRTVEVLAEVLHGSERNLLRVDCGEFQMEHEVAKLVGAPPGYLGHRETPPMLTQQKLSSVASESCGLSLVLFDEIEKAHPDVFNVLLQVLDDGRLTDGQGRTVDFKNTVIVMTSNIGSQLIQSMADKKQAEIKEAVFEQLKNHFRPEFLNRIDEIVVFHGLGKDNIANIAKILLKNLSERLARVDMQLEVSDAALSKLAEVGFDPIFGARPLKRAIQQHIENPVSKMILEGKFGPKDVVPVDVDKNGEFSFTRQVH